METVLIVALVVYIIGVLYFALFVAAPIVAGADCDHAFLIMAPIAFALVMLWPLVLIWGVYERLRAWLLGERG